MCCTTTQSWQGVRAAPVASPGVPAHSGIKPSCAGRVSWAAHPLTAVAAAPAVEGNPGRSACIRDALGITGGGSLRAALHAPMTKGTSFPPGTLDQGGEPFGSPLYPH